jgi:hypothetical protein
VWTISVQTVESAKSTSKGGKKTLSVRLAARITWKSESATSRNSERRGRASRSCSAWVRMAKWARATTASSPRAKSQALANMIAPIDPFRTRPLRCQPWGARSSAAAPIPRTARATAHGASCPVMASVELAVATIAMAEAGRGTSIDSRNSLRLMQPLPAHPDRG